MHIHILGICGTFMAGIAILAKQQGHHVTGSDMNVYPPMSTQLQAQGITLLEGYSSEHLMPHPDYVIIGNGMKRGNPAVEYALANNLAYISGPQWLAEQILRSRWVLAVAGTHGKTTTTSMLSWILQQQNFNPGFLIGGIPQNFGYSAQLGDSDFFVIEADEYDTAFFDKRSKFIHYHPRTLILNNLEFDHADIFADLAAIKTQFHHLVRTIPNNGLIICPRTDRVLQSVLEQGCWTPVSYTGGKDGTWQATEINADGNEFTVTHEGKAQGRIKWSLLGTHNIANALAAIAAAQHVGIIPEYAIHALNSFKNVKRRLEIIGQIEGITIYDDFAHHPTAIATTLKGLRAHVKKARIIAILELGSYTMRTGVHRENIGAALADADQILLARPQVDWGIDEVAARSTVPAHVYDNIEDIIAALIPNLQANDHIVIMSNTGFAGIHQKLLTALQR